MQNLLIYNKGYNGTGKSKAIKAVFFRLIAEHSEQIEIKRLLHGSLNLSDNEDLGVIFSYRGILVGLESEGDPNGKYMQLSLKEFQKELCTIIICACRTKGDTINALKKLWLPEGDFVPVACPHFVLSLKYVQNACPDEIYRRLSESYADEVIHLIDMWIDGVCQYDAKAHKEEMRNIKQECSSMYKPSICNNGRKRENS